MQQLVPMTSSLITLLERVMAISIYIIPIPMARVIIE
nr:MAG TPA: hypothetical protein [Bacteriophage sp.]